MLVILLWSNLEDIKCGFVDEKCVDGNFVSITQEVNDCWLSGESDCD
jgi:hypothetical protein